MRLTVFSLLVFCCVLQWGSCIDSDFFKDEENAMHFADFLNSRNLSPNDIDRCHNGPTGIFGRAASFFFRRNTAEIREVVRTAWFHNDGQVRNYLYGLSATNNFATALNEEEVTTIASAFHANIKDVKSLEAASWRDYHSVFASACKSLSWQNTLNNRLYLYNLWEKNNAALREKLSHLLTQTPNSPFFKSHPSECERPDYRVPEIDLIESEDKQVESVEAPTGDLKRAHLIRKHPVGFGKCSIHLGSMEVSQTEYELCFEDQELVHETFNALLRIKCSRYIKECPFQIRYKRVNRGAPKISATMYCRHKDCRLFKFVVHTVPTSTIPSTADLYCSTIEINHRCKLPIAIRGQDRRELEKNINTENPSVVLFREYATSDYETMASGNLMRCSTLQTYQKIGEDMRKKKDLHPDPYIDLYLRQKQEINSARLASRSKNGTQNNSVSLETAVHDELSATDLKYCMIWNLQPSPFRCNLYSIQQLEVLEYVGRKTGSKPILNFDATGSIIKNMGSKDVYLYAGVVHFEGNIIPICELLTDDQTAFSIRRFLEDWVRFGEKHMGSRALIGAVVVDFSKAMMKACSEGLNNLEQTDYINHCFRYLQKEKGVSMDGVIPFVICNSHLQHLVAKDAEKFSDNSDSKNFKKEVMAAIITAPSWSYIVNVFREAVIVFENQYISSSVSDALGRLRDVVRRQQLIKIEMKTVEPIEDALQGVLYKDSFFFKHFHKIKQETLANQGRFDLLTDAAAEEIELRINPLFSPGWIDHMIQKYLFALPLVSFVLLFHISKVSNQAVENHFRREKNVVLKGKKRLKPGRYIDIIKDDVKGACNRITLDVTSPLKRPESEDSEKWCKRKKPALGLGKKKPDSSHDMKNLLDPNLLVRDSKPLVSKQFTQKGRGKNKPNLTATHENQGRKMQRTGEVVEVADNKRPKMEKSQLELMRNRLRTCMTQQNMEQVPSDTPAANYSVEEPQGQGKGNHVVRSLAGVVLNPDYHLTNNCAENDPFICRVGEIDVRRSDFKTLQGKMWLINRIIDAFLATNEVRMKVSCLPCTRGKNILDARGTGTKEEVLRLADHVGDERMLLDDLDEVSVISVSKPDISKNEDILDLHSLTKSRYIAIPYHINDNHWVLIFADVEESTVRFYDPLDAFTTRERSFLLAFQKMWDGLKDCPRKMWKLARETGAGKNLPKQKDGCNCGVHVCQAIYILAGVTGATKESLMDPKLFRRAMMKNILEGSVNIKDRCSYCGMNEKRVHSSYAARVKEVGMSASALKCLKCRRIVHSHCALLGRANYNPSEFICACCIAWYDL